MKQHDTSFLVLSGIVSLIIWLNQISSLPVDSTCDWHLSSFMLVKLVIWQIFLSFWWLHEDYLRSHRGIDPFLPSATDYITRSSINSWTLTYSFMTALVYLALFTTDSLKCPIFKLQWRVVYQWIMVLVMGSVTVTLFMMRRRLKRVYAVVIKVCLWKRRQRNLRATIEDAKQLAGTREGARNYEYLLNVLADFETDNNWTHQGVYALINMPLLYENPDSAVTDLDLHFWVYLAKPFRPEMKKHRTYDSCTICSETLLNDEKTLDLGCCGSIFHWMCLKKHLLTNKKCPSCRTLSVGRIRQQVFQKMGT